MLRLFLAAIAVFFVAATAAYAGPRPNPNEGGGGTGGGQVCTWGGWIAPGAADVCGYNNWREIVNSTYGLGAGGCYVSVWFAPNGPSDLHCGDRQNFTVHGYGTYNKVTIFNGSPWYVWVTGTANT